MINFCSLIEYYLGCITYFILIKLSSSAVSLILLIYVCSCYCLPESAIHESTNTRSLQILCFLLHISSENKVQKVNVNLQPTIIKF
jgi:hypothetical protein